VLGAERGATGSTGSAGATTGFPLSGNAVQAASIDQVVADLISKGAPFRSIEMGVTPATPNGPQDSLATVSHSGPNARKNPEFDPKAVFNRLFGGSTTTPPSTGEKALFSVCGAGGFDDGGPEKATDHVGTKRRLCAWHCDVLPAAMLHVNRVLRCRHDDGCRCRTRRAAPIGRSYPSPPTWPELIRR